MFSKSSTKKKSVKKDVKNTTDRVSFKEFFSIAKWLFSLQLQIASKLTLFYVVFRLAGNLLTFVNRWLVARLLDQVIDIANFSKDITLVYPYFVALLAYSIVKRIIGTGRSLSWNFLSRKSGFMIKKFFYERLHFLGIQTLEDPKIVNMTSRATSSLYGLNNFFRQEVSLIVTFASFIVSLVIVAQKFPVIVPLVIVAALPEILFDKKFRILAWNLNKKYTERFRMYSNLVSFLESSSDLMEITLLKAKDFLGDRFLAFREDHYAAFSENSIRWIVGGDAFGFLGVIAYYIGYLLIIIRLIEGDISVGDVVFYTGLISRLSSDFEQFMREFNNIFEYSVKFKEAHKLFHMPRAFEDGTTKMEVLDQGPSIVFKNVNFTYPKAKKSVIQNLNIEIKSGEKLAIVGHNGAGKTTIAKLLSRIYLPSEGDILINDVSIKDLYSESLYDNMAVLFQEYNNYTPLNVRENVAIGSPHEKIDDARVIDALKKADAWGFVKEYENGLDQLMSPTYKGGIRPSTGQWQKIAIARFFYRNAPLVIFDEPTAAIDAISEYNIFNKIYEFFESKTVIIISHRFSTVRNADRIIVVENGKIIEQGTHTELLAHDGYYAKSFKLQAEGYSSDPVESIV